MQQWGARAARNGIADMLRRTVARQPNKAALRWNERQWTFSTLETASQRVADRLTELGLVKGDRIAAFARNSDAYLLLWLACTQAGLIHVPVNYGLTPAELRYILEQSGSRALVIDHALAGHLSAVTDLPDLQFVGGFEGCLADRPTPDLPDIGRLADRINVIGWASDDSHTPRRDWGIGGDDFAQIIYTSGTTGLPKGGLMKHSALIAEYLSCIHACQFDEDDRVLFALPLYHAGQMHTFTMPQLLVGSECVLIEQPKPEVVFEMIERHRISSFFAPPTSWVSLLRHPGFDQHDLSTLRKLYYGASIMPAPILAELRERLPGNRTYNCYGQSEVGPLATVLRPEDHDGRLTSAGKPVLNVETRVVDENMNDMPVGQVGEIVHRSPQLITCYWNKPEETAEAFTGDWFHSGDIGYFDSEGFLYIVDRLKDVINSGGVLVASREVEDALFKHPAVHEVAVVGLPDAKWIEAVAAVVVLREGARVTEAELIEHARSQLAYYKVPKRILFVDELPRNASGKILKRELRRIHGGTEAAFVTDAPVPGQNTA